MAETTASERHDGDPTSLDDRVRGASASERAGGAPLEPWARADRVGLLLTLGLVLTPLLTRVDYSGSWDADSSGHLRLAMDAANRVVQEHGAGRDPLRGFLQAYYYVPKMLHEVLLATFILVINGFRTVTYAQAEQTAAWFATLWTLAGLLALYHCARCYVDRLTALAATVVFGLAGYILLYANFPRSNMAAHALCWIASALYLRWRIRSRSLSPWQALTLGVIFGIAVPVHYASAYWVIGVLLSELVLGLVARSFRPTILALSVIGGGATLVWFGVDLYYFYYAQRYPGETNFLGQNISAGGFSFLRGMTVFQQRLDVQAMAGRLAPQVWWFLPGFTYRNLGPFGTALLGFGSWELVRRLRAVRSQRSPAQLRALLILVTQLALTAALSLGFFAAARKLMTFYPAVAILVALGVARLVGVGGSMSRWLPWLGGTSARAWLLIAVVAAQITTFYPEASRIYHARRAVGYMRSYLREHGINRILVMPRGRFAASMAPVQDHVAQVDPDWADRHEFIVLNRLLHERKPEKERLLDRLRRVEPVVAFDNQVSLPIYWYEFPLKKEFLDPQDPMTHRRALYRWKDVRAAIRDHLGQ